mgnify:CR=1 FL=1
MSNEIEQQVRAEIRVLTLLDELANALRDNPELQDRVSERMANSNTGKELREVVMQRRAAQSYYNEEHAIALQPYLDMMIQSDCKKPIIFTRAAFPGVSPRTIYLRVYQAWQWLRDKHPERQKYIDLYSRTNITQNPSSGVAIREKKRAVGPLVGIEMVESVEHLAKVQQEISTALSKPQTLPFAVVYEKKGLTLSEDDQNAIKDGLAGIEGVVCKVTEHQVMVARRISE